MNNESSSKEMNSKKYDYRNRIHLNSQQMLTMEGVLFCEIGGVKFTILQIVSRAGRETSVPRVFMVE